MAVLKKDDLWQIIAELIKDDRRRLKQVCRDLDYDPPEKLPEINPNLHGVFSKYREDWE